MQVISKNWKRQGRRFSPKPAEVTQLYWRLDFRASDLQNCKIISLCYFKPLNLWFVLHENLRLRIVFGEPNPHQGLCSNVTLWRRLFWIALLKWPLPSNSLPPPFSLFLQRTYHQPTESILDWLLDWLIDWFSLSPTGIQAPQRLRLCVVCGCVLP